ncbi:hypothetical protein OROMI_021610 [Orobanche minor]
MLVTKVLLLPWENHWKLVVLMLVAKVLPVAMGKSLEIDQIGRSYACDQGAAVAMGKSLEIGRAYACGQGAAVAIGKSLEIGRAYACGQGVACCHGKIT